MTATISVVVPIRDAGDALPKFCASLDRQTLSTDAWEVIFIDGGSEDTSAARVGSLAHYRPNAAVLSAPRSATWWDLAHAGIETAVGSWVLLCDAEDELTKAALERLNAVVTNDPGYGAVVARSVDRTRQGVDETLFAETESDDVSPAAFLAPAVLVRRDALNSVGPDQTTGPWPVAQLAAILATPEFRIGRLPDYPVLVGTGVRDRLSSSDRLDDVLAALERAERPATFAPALANELGRVGGRIAALDRLADITTWAQRLRADMNEGPERCLLTLVADQHYRAAGELAELLAAPSLVTRPAEVAWAGTRVRIRAEAVLSLDAQTMNRLLADGVDPGQLLGSVRPRLGLRNRLTTSIYPIQDDVEHTVTPDAAGVAVAVTSEIDPLTLNEGGVLPRAAYQVVLEVLGLGWGAIPQSSLQVAVDLPAVLGNNLVSVRQVARSGLHIDVNARRRSLLGPLDPASCTVSETARGSKLSVTLPGLVVDHAPKQIEGHVVLGRLPFPATLITSTPPRLECFVSGLPGRAVIKTRIGGTIDSPSGCELVTAMDGGFSVRASTRRSVPPAPKEAKAPDAVALRVEKVEKAVETLAARLEAAAARLETSPARTTGTLRSAGSGYVRAALKQVPGLRPMVRAGRRAVKRGRAQVRTPGRG